MTTTMPARDLDRLSRSGLTAADLDNLDDDLRGHTAYDRVGEEIGTVEDVLVDTLLLRAPGGDQPWCVGTVHARVREWRARTCQPQCARPIYRTLTRFSFQVVRPSTDTAPPVFAGLQSAFACTPGPQTPGETTPFTLTWKPATDNVMQFLIKSLDGDAKSAVEGFRKDADKSNP